MTLAERQAIAERHFRDPAYSGDWCVVCTDTYASPAAYPCDAARLLAALTEAERRLAEIDGGPCARCGEVRDRGIHDTIEMCEDLRGDCFDPARHHPFEVRP